MPGKFAHGAVFQKFLFLAGLDFDETRFRHVGRQLGEPGGIGKTGGHGDFHFTGNALANFADVFLRRRVAPDHTCPSS